MKPCNSLMKWFGAMAISTSVASALAADKPEAIQWSARDARGAAVGVPAENRVTVLLFVMPGQPQSVQAIKELAALVKAGDGLQVLVVVSGEQAEQQSAELAKSGNCPWPSVADKDYSVSARLGVRVWPTTVVVDAAGQVAGHVGGMPKGYAKDMDGFLAFAGKRIDAATLEKRLGEHDVVVDGPEQVAARHLMVAQRLIDKGLAEQAKAELATALKLHPKSAALQLAMARVMVSMGDAAEAVKLLDSIEAGAVSPPQLAMLRGRALVVMGKWEEAVGVLKDAVRLNPQPAEAWYELGRVYEHAKDWPQAAEAFRKAFETSEAGRKMAPNQ